MCSIQSTYPIDVEFDVHRFVATVVNKLVPCCAWLLSSALEVLGLRLTDLSSKLLAPSRISLVIALAINALSDVDLVYYSVCINFTDLNCHLLIINIFIAVSARQQDISYAK